MYGGGFGGGTGIRVAPGVGAPGGGQGRLRSAIDSQNGNDALGRVYDARVIRRMPKYMGWVKKSLMVAVTGTALRTAANLVMPLLVKVITDTYISTKNIGGLNLAVFMYVGAAAVMWLGQYLETLYLSYSGQGILLRMRNQMFAHLLELSLGFFDHNKVGKLMSRVQNDIDQLQTLLTQDIIFIAADTVTLVGIAIVMLSMNTRLALITLSVVPVLGIILFLWQRHTRAAFVRVRQAIAEVNDNLQESISGVRVTQGMSREEVNLGQFDNVNKVNLNANVAAAKLQAFMMPVVQVLTDGGFCLVLVFGGMQVLAGQTTAGVILAFLLYIQKFFAPVQDLTMMYTDLQRAMASGVRIFELLDVEPEIKDKPDAIEMPKIEGKIEFKHVSFSYETSAEVLHDVNFEIKPGETVAIVGRTGAGKSSIANLITRFYEPQKGEILIDRHNIGSVTQSSLRRQIGLVPQDPFLFSGTVADNIRYGRPESTSEDVIAAGKTAGVHEAIMELDNGYDTFVGEKGSNLSGGQRQFVCLARAVLADPAILILDEATSSVDTNTERIIQESLLHIAQGRTCVIIAHRLSTITSADRIIALENGRIVEVGNHQELMEKQGLYYHLFQTLSAPGLEQMMA